MLHSMARGSDEFEIGEGHLRTLRPYSALRPCVPGVEPHAAGPSGHRGRAAQCALAPRERVLGGTTPKSVSQLKGRIEMTGDEFERMARQVRAAAEAAGRALQPFVEQQRRLAEQLQPIMETSQRIAEAFQPFARQIQEMQARMSPFLEEIGRAFRDLPERNQKALRILAVNGWYVDPELSIPDLFEAADLFEGGATGRAHQKLCDHFDNRLDDIQRDICGRFLNRARVLKQAFDAHRRGEYALAIPVFLSQADGICQELVGVQLYARRNGMPELAAYLRIEDAMSFRASLLYPLVEPNPISAGSAERAGLSDLLNRHAILHGESFDYDTKLNSCRSVSLLAYVAWILDKRLDGAA